MRNLYFVSTFTERLNREFHQNKPKYDPENLQIKCLSSAAVLNVFRYKNQLNNTE